MRYDPRKIDPAPEQNSMRGKKKMAYNPGRIEKRWQRVWKKIGIFEAKARSKKPKFYCLDMFPYPSFEGLHVGHPKGYVASDVVARFKRMQGYNVLHPMGWDAFGLPAENYAVKTGIHPRISTQKNIKKIKKQLQALGLSYDWSREIDTSDPGYYQWTQWMFWQLYKAGLAYKANVPANFCPSCKTVLANEQVVNGKCERCDSEVFQKEIEQWMFRVTDFAEDLLSDLDKLDWPAKTKIMQKNWIGKSEGWTIKFQITNSKFQTSSKSQIPNFKQVEVFTTRADTLFGATYLVIAPEHPIIENLKSQITNYKFVKNYIEESKKKTERERISEVKEKTGIEIKGLKAINPANGRDISIWIADYVLVHYGTGAIMAVPAHDQRDFDFARTYNLPVLEVIESVNEGKKLPQKVSLVVSDGRFDKASQGEGILINSGKFNGLDSGIAKERIGKWLELKALARKAVYYKLRDWIISRQRYWGAPIPMIFCQKCAWQQVPERELPLLLPRIKDFQPKGQGRSPLANSKKFVETICPKCHGLAQRETDTMDTFVCSSWYYLRYTDPQNEKKFASKQNIKRWLPVDLYVGGAEHAVMHLLYVRFFAKVLNRLGYLDFKEPFLKLRHQGLILGPDNQKMSKSKGNIISPDEVVSKYGADTMRLYEMFMGPFGDEAPWDIKGIKGCNRFLEKVWKIITQKEITRRKEKEDLKKLLHQTIKKVTEDIESFKFNTAISTLMVLANGMVSHQVLSEKTCKSLLLLLVPFVPHFTEELWQQIKATPPSLKELKIRDSIHSQAWPKYNPRFIKEENITLVVQVNGKVRDKIVVEADISEKKAKELVLSREKVQKWIEGKEVKKVVFVPGKLINFVV